MKKKMCFLFIASSTIPSSSATLKLDNIHFHINKGAYCLHAVQKRNQKILKSTINDSVSL